jgi:hypothetical protein
MSGKYSFEKSKEYKPEQPKRPYKRKESNNQDQSNQKTRGTTNSSQPVQSTGTTYYGPQGGSQNYTIEPPLGRLEPLPPEYWENDSHQQQFQTNTRFPNFQSNPQHSTFNYRSPPAPPPKKQPRFVSAGPERKTYASTATPRQKREIKGFDRYKKTNNYIREYLNSVSVKNENRNKLKEKLIKDISIEKLIINYFRDLGNTNQKISFKKIKSVYDNPEIMQRILEQEPELLNHYNVSRDQPGHFFVESKNLVQGYTRRKQPPQNASRSESSQPPFFAEPDPHPTESTLMTTEKEAENPPTTNIRSGNHNARNPNANQHIIFNPMNFENFPDSLYPFNNPLFSQGDENPWGGQPSRSPNNKQMNPSTMPQGTEEIDWYIPPTSPLFPLNNDPLFREQIEEPAEASNQSSYTFLYRNDNSNAFTPSVPCKTNSSGRSRNQTIGKLFVNKDKAVREYKLLKDIDPQGLYTLAPLRIGFRNQNSTERLDSCIILLETENQKLLDALSKSQVSYREEPYISQLIFPYGTEFNSKKNVTPESMDEKFLFPLLFFTKMLGYMNTNKHCFHFSITQRNILYIENKFKLRNFSSSGYDMTDFLYKQLDSTARWQYSKYNTIFFNEYPEWTEYMSPEITYLNFLFFYYLRTKNINPDLKDTDLKRTVIRTTDKSFEKNYCNNMINFLLSDETDDSTNQLRTNFKQEISPNLKIQLYNIINNNFIQTNMKQTIQNVVRDVLSNIFLLKQDPWGFGVTTFIWLRDILGIPNIDETTRQILDIFKNKIVTKLLVLDQDNRFDFMKLYKELLSELEFETESFFNRYKKHDNIQYKYNQ